jgi:hypothetical protein
LAQPQLTFEEATLLCQMKLWCNFDFHHLAYLFGVSESTATTAFHTILGMVCAMLESEHFSFDTAHGLIEAMNNRLECFNEFPKCVMVLDCTEF